MNTKTILTAALLAALGVSAADVPYTPGVNPGSGVEMTFDGSGNITSLAATPMDSGTITLTGGAALGGATMIGAGMKAVVSASASNAAALSDAISGDGDFKIEATSGNATATISSDMSGLVGGLFTVEGMPNATFPSVLPLEGRQ